MEFFLADALKVFIKPTIEIKERGLESLPDSTVKIILRDMELDVRIGLHAHEHERSQRVHVSVELYADGRNYLKAASRETIIDYDHVYKAIRAWAGKSHVLLIETYIHELMAICFADARVRAARVAITKPDIFPEARAAGVEVFLRRADFEA
jgi:7,8-dihydroneopterin aldolase/epimerase/oxygenase